MTTAVVLYCRDEIDLIVEWLGHYRALGFDKVYVFDNMSTDGTYEILQHVEAYGCGAPTVSGGAGAPRKGSWLHVERWADTVADRHSERQRLAYMRGLEYARRDGIEWLLAVDTDEFLMSVNSESLTDMLWRLRGWAAIGFHWCFYGSCGYVETPAGLWTENFLTRGSENFGPSRHIKSIVQVKLTQGFWNAHAASMDFPYANCREQQIGWHGLPGLMDNGPGVVFSPWRINHYWTGSRQHFDRKIRRSKSAVGFSGRKELDFDTYDLNDSFDATGLRYSGRIREGVAEIGLPEIPVKVTKQPSENEPHQDKA